ncbi:hypothetical protein [Granulicella sibirica]|nr:hypothetical protein [Granulicella sibirica]
MNATEKYRRNSRYRRETAPPKQYLRRSLTICPQQERLQLQERGEFTYDSFQNMRGFRLSLLEEIDLAAGRQSARAADLQHRETCLHPPVFF